MRYKVVREDSCESNVVCVYDNYEEALAQAVKVAKNCSSSEFYDEIEEALDERGYYMCGWSSTQVRIEME